LVIFIVVVSVLALLITINAIQGTLWHPESWSVVVRDLNVLFLARSEPTSGTYFPLQRDLATFFVIMLEGTNVLIIIRQWRAIGSLLPKMQKEGVLTFVSVEGESAEETRGKLDKGIAKINRRFETASKSWLWLMAAFVALALVLAENNLGIFTHVTASPSRSWTLQAYQGWWANLDTHGFAFGVYFMLAVLVMRYVIAQNYVGIEVLGFFFRHRKRVKYTFDDLDGDRHFGWNSVRQVMWTIYISVLLNATALGLQIIIVPTPIVSRFPESLWSFVLLAILFALGPVFVFLPCWLLSTQLKRHKGETVTLLKAEPLAGPNGDPIGPVSVRYDVRTAKDKAEAIRAINVMPNFPVKIRTVFWIALLNLTVAGGSLVTIAGFFRGH